MVIAQNKRWFIWTLVVLLVAGVALVSYINFTDVDASGDQGSWLVHHAKVLRIRHHSTTKAPTTIKK